MAALAAEWLLELSLDEPPANDAVGGEVVLMNFTAPPEVQWTFLQATVDGARTDDQLYAIAAGPFEHLLGFHGEDFIAPLEARCRDNVRFARMTTAAYQHLMSDAVWRRVQAIQATVTDTL
ncbi:hypothetical protein BH10PSE14_BH10PSE14_19190 [soil metagenome]